MYQQKESQTKGAALKSSRKKFRLKELEITKPWGLHDWKPRGPP